MCKPTHESFDNRGTHQLLETMLTLYRRELLQFKGFVDEDQFNSLIYPLNMTCKKVQVMPIRHSDICVAVSYFDQVRLSVTSLQGGLIESCTESDTKVKLLLNWFALVELHNSIRNLFDCIHALSHVEDSVDMMEFEAFGAIADQLRKLLLDGD